MILDSGSRREFESGAVRDCATGKGRMDLTPLREASLLFNEDDYFVNILCWIDEYIYSGNIECIKECIKVFSEHNFDCPETALIEVSKQYEEGCIKYCERNWEKGIPTHCYIDSAVRHMTKHHRGDTDERHDRATLWNLFGILWNEHHRTDLIDVPFAKKMSDKRFQTEMSKLTNLDLDNDNDYPLAEVDFNTGRAKKKTYLTENN